MANNIQMNNQQNLNTLPGSNTIGHNGTTGPTGPTGPNEVIEMIMGYQKSQVGLKIRLCLDYIGVAIVD